MLQFSSSRYSSVVIVWHSTNITYQIFFKKKVNYKKLFNSIIVDKVKYTYKLFNNTSSNTIFKNTEIYNIELFCSLKNFCLKVN